VANGPLTMKRSVVIAAVLAAGAAAWILSGQIGGTRAIPETTKPPAALESEAAVPDVRVATLTAQPMTDELVLYGQTKADRKAEIRAETRGRVVKVVADDGDRLQAGDEILALDRSDRPARLREARALLAQRQIEYDAASKLAQKGFKAKTQLAAAEAALEAARAAVAAMEEDIDDTVIRAAFDGIIDQRTVDLGDYVDPGDRVALIVDVDPIRVTAAVSERDVSKVEPGSKGTARLVTGEQVEGTIGYVASVADAATRTFRVELDVPNPMGRIVEGATAELHVPLPAVDAHFIAPSMLSLSDDGKIGVKTVDDDNRVRFRPVEILRSTEDGIWVGGLPDTVTAITIGHEFVVAGQSIRPVHQAAQSADGAVAR
jgi:multidrug efflux system membrane fusion protein